MFINGVWTEPIKIDNDPIKITKNNVNMSHMLSKESMGGYIMTYSLTIYSHDHDFTQLRDKRRLDMKSVEDAVMSKFSNTERNYITIKNLKFNEVQFSFEWKKWIQDTIRGVNPKTSFTKYERRFDFKIGLPKIMIYTYDDYLGKFIEKKFQEVVPDNRFNSWFRTFIPREFKNQIKIKTKSLFDYSYDRQSNQMSIKIKDQYVLAFLFAIGIGIDKYRKNRNSLVKIDFEKKVKQRTQKFDRKKWESFIKKRFI